MKISDVLFLLLSFVFLSAVLFSFAKDRAESPNDLGFMAGIVAQTRFNRFNIDGTPQIATRDKAFYDGKFYSSKPPLLVFGVGQVIKNSFALVKPVLLQNDIPTYQTGVFLTATIPTILISLSIFVLLFFKKRTGLLSALFFSLLFPFATLFFSYVRYLNNHTLTALFVFGLFGLFLMSRPRLLLMGLFLSLILVSDPSFFAVVALVSVFPLYKICQRDWRKYLTILLGFLPLAIFSFYFNHNIFGVLYPIQMNMPKYFGYVGSHLYNVTNPWDINVYRPNILILFFNNLFGTHGIFLYMPALLFFFFYKRKKELGWIFTLFFLIVSVVVYSITSPNFGGWSYGNRRLLPLLPLLYYYAVLTFYDVKRKWLKSLFITLFIISIFFSYLGFKNTWFNKKLHINRDFAYFPLLYNLNKDYFGGIVQYDH